APNASCNLPVEAVRFTVSDIARTSVPGATVPASSTLSASNVPATLPSLLKTPAWIFPARAPVASPEIAGASTAPSTEPLTTIGQVEVSEPLRCVPSSTSVRFWGAALLTGRGGGFFGSFIGLALSHIATTAGCRSQATGSPQLLHSRCGRI